MNSVIIIGNGFDLAHGLKTKYSDFILWYFNQILGSLNRGRTPHYNDKLLTLQLNGGYKAQVVIQSIEHLKEILGSGEYVIQFSSRQFIEKIIQNIVDFKWVDIEYEYYFQLESLYKSIERGQSDRVGVLQRLKSLNISFEFLKRKLIDYLTTIKTSEIKIPAIEQQLKKIAVKIHPNAGENLLIINFNYTSLIHNYFSEIKTTNSKIIDIHGSIGNDKNPIIFGYGDEMDEYYTKIERLNENAFLKNFKSFSYFYTNNYRSILSFISDETDYDVYILGHSCGISDRILLNNLFDNDRCKNINILYHKREDGTNDFFEKTQELSRHFSATGKKEMRNKIVPFEESKPLAQIDTTDE